MMMNLMMRLWKDEEGQGTIEYALIAVFISIVAIGALLVVTDDVADMWDAVKDGVAKWNPGAAGTD